MRTLAEKDEKQMRRVKDRPANKGEYAAHEFEIFGLDIVCLSEVRMGGTGSKGIG